MNIAIDGPAGAGKSTVARNVAAELGYIYVDTGAMYRAMGLYIVRQGIDPADTARVVRASENADITIGYENGEQHIFLNGRDVSALIRTEEAGAAASAVSVIGEVRRKLVDLQKKLAARTSVVMDGRDIGTVVLPDAEVKIYLTASAGTRAVRRYRELLERASDRRPRTVEEEKREIAGIEREIRERDERDMTRKESPLKKASDAVVIDSSELTAGEVTERILKLVRERSGSGSEASHEG